MNSPKNHNLWTAMVTPFSKENRVDFTSLKTLLTRQADAGNAILLLGSTGESLTLSLKEKTEIIDFAIKLKLSVPLMAGVGGVNIENTIEWVKLLESRDIHAYLLVTPLYAKPGKTGQYNWFKTLLDLSSRPCMLYNIPGRTGCSLNLEAVKLLASHDNFWAIKEASGSISDFQNYSKSLPDIAIYSGDDGLLPNFSLYDAKGLVSVSSNIWPKETSRYVTACLNRRLNGLWPLWKDATDALFSTSNPVPVKALLHKVGLIETPMLRAPLSHKDLSTIDELLEAHDKISNWAPHTDETEIN